MSHDVVVFICLIPIREELGIDPLSGVVIALVFAVDEQVDERAPRLHLPSVQAEAAGPFIFNERAGVVVHAGTQHDPVERLHRGIAKQRILQTAHAVVAPKVQPE